ncbi:hypothetical protein DM02DRAFT_620349 [Periconia macrospinosa]|uniref:Uncharacterized protein n=1 Tax=Periconia macrospinosa TaxID=97972 RepID=A0A2V1D299_9PLEO|nr:hypothetical protein DM02DRAFT_620349 [Periconia macrospinosa]
MRSLTIPSSYTDLSIPSALYGKTKSKWATCPPETSSDLQLLNKPIAYGVIDVVRDDLGHALNILPIERRVAMRQNIPVKTV